MNSGQDKENRSRTPAEIGGLVALLVLAFVAVYTYEIIVTIAAALPLVITVLLGVGCIIYQWHHIKPYVLALYDSIGPHFSWPRLQLAFIVIVLIFSDMSATHRPLANGYDSVNILVAVVRDKQDAEYKEAQQRALETALREEARLERQKQSDKAAAIKLATFLGLEPTDFYRQHIPTSCVQSCGGPIINPWTGKPVRFSPRPLSIVPRLLEHIH